MTPEQRERIENYVLTLDNTVTAGAQLDLVIDLTVDRVLLFLNDVVLDERLERIVAQVVATNYHAIQSNAGGVKETVSRIEDNGQAITYSKSAVKHFSGDDEAVFGGFEKLLRSYRRVHVTTTEL